MPFPTKKRKWNLFNPASKEPFTLSRSKIDLFVTCPRCFYFDTVRGVGRPKGPSFTLNNAVDTLLKKEFDIHRTNQTTHPLMKVYGIDAVPFDHAELEAWRDALKRGVSTHHKATNLIIRGGIDDVWKDADGKLIVVDYKATSKDGKITLDDEWKIQYKRQLEIYQWLFRQNGFKVSDTGYFVYVNGKTDKKSFDGKLEFDVAVIPYEGKTDWIETVLEKVKKTLMSEEIPKANPDCEFCSYIDLIETEARMGKSQPTEKPTRLAKAAKTKKTVKKVRSETKDSNQNLF